MNGYLILPFLLVAFVSSASDYCVATFVERRNGPDARVPYNADTTRLIPC